MVPKYTAAVNTSFKIPPVLQIFKQVFNTTCTTNSSIVVMDNKARRSVSSAVNYDFVAEELEIVTAKVEDTMSSLKNLLNSIRIRTEELRAHEMRIQDMEEAMRVNRDKVATIIKLNIRGKKFAAYKDTMVKVPGTYFFGMLSSSMFQPELEGEYFIDRHPEGFDRIIEYLKTGVLFLQGLNEYEVDCVYDNLDYFNIPHKRRWKYEEPTLIEGVKFGLCTELKDGRVCGKTENNEVCIYNAITNSVENPLVGHTDIIWEVIQLADERICSCSNDTTIKVWCATSCACQLTIIGHTHWVCSLIQLVDGRLCSGSTDKTIKVWNKHSGVCEHTIIVGSQVVCLAQLTDGRICSGSNKTTGNIKIYSLTTGDCDMTLNGHNGIVTRVVQNNDRLCSCSKDGTIKVWNISTGVCERTLEGHTANIPDMVLLEDGRLCSSSEDGYLKLWNVESGVCQQTMKHTVGRLLQLQDGRLLSSSFKHKESFVWN